MLIVSGSAEDQTSVPDRSETDMSSPFRSCRKTNIWSNRAIARRLIGAWLREPGQFFNGKLPRLCPICSHDGIMISVGHPARWDARCAKCGSRERHRLLWLWATGAGVNRLAGKRILHFAPEKALRRVLSGNPAYETADLRQPHVRHQVDTTASNGGRDL